MLSHISLIHLNLLLVVMVSLFGVLRGKFNFDMYNLYLPVLSYFSAIVAFQGTKEYASTMLDTIPCTQSVQIQ